MGCVQFSICWWQLHHFQSKNLQCRAPPKAKSFSLTEVCAVPHKNNFSAKCLFINMHKNLLVMKQHRCGLQTYFIINVAMKQIDKINLKEIIATVRGKDQFYHPKQMFVRFISTNF